MLESQTLNDGDDIDFILQVRENQYPCEYCNSTRSDGKLGNIIVIYDIYVNYIGVPPDQAVWSTKDSLETIGSKPNPSCHTFIKIKCILHK